MKVLFSQEFKDELARFDGNIKITRYTLEEGSTKNMKSWLNAPITPYSESNTCNGIWDKENLSLKLYLEFPSNYIVNLSNKTNDTVESEKRFNIIRFYFGTRKTTAFILVADRDGSDIVFSQTKNLIDVSFPKNTVANVFMESTTQDIDFLEASGLGISNNLFRENGIDLVELSSYYKYLLVNTTEDTESVVSPFIDAFGRRIADNYKYRLYSNLKLTASNLTPKAMLPEVRYSLSPDGGEVYFYGTVDYVEYRYKQGEITKISEGSCCASEIPGIKILCTKDTGLIYSVNNQGLYIVYGNKRQDYNCTADFILSAEFFDPLNGEYKKIESDAIRLTQQEENLNWNIVDPGTTYSEEGCPLYLFEYDSGTSGQIKKLQIHTYLGGSTSDIKYVFPNEEYKNLVTITSAVKSSNESRKERVYEFTIMLNQDNIGTTWFPGYNSDKTLPKISIQYETYSIDIIVVQKANMSGLVLGKIPSLTVDDYDIVHNIQFEPTVGDFTENMASGLILTINGIDKDNEDESVLGEESWWKVIENPDPEKIFINSSEGFENCGQLSYSLESSNSRQFSILTDILPSDAYDKDIGNIIFRRINPSEINEDFPSSLTWIEEIDSKRLSIPMMIKGNDVEMSVSAQVEDGGVILFPRDGSINISHRVKKILVKSNCKFRCKVIYEDENTSKFGKAYIYESGNEKYESTEYDLESGKAINLVYENIGDLANSTATGALDEYKLGKLLISASVEGKETVYTEYTIMIGEFSDSRIPELTPTLSPDEDTNFSKFIFLDLYDEVSKSYTSSVIPRIFIEKRESNEYGIHLTENPCSYVINGEGDIIDVTQGFKIERETSPSKPIMYPVKMDHRINVTTNFRNKVISSRTGVLSYYVCPKAEKPRVEFYDLENINKISSIIIPSGSRTVKLTIRSLYQLHSDSCKLDMIINFGDVNTVTLDYKEDLEIDGYKWKIYTVTIKFGRDQSAASSTKIGVLKVESRIIPPKNTWNSGASAIDYVISKYSENVMYEGDIYVPDDNFIEWVNNNLGIGDSKIVIIQSEFPGAAAGVTIDGPRSIELPPCKSSINYTVYPAEVKLKQSDFIVSEDLFIDITKTGYAVTAEDRIPKLNELIDSETMPLLVKKSADKYLALSTPRELMYTTKFVGVNGDDYYETFKVQQRGLVDALFMYIDPSQVSSEPELYIDYLKDTPYIKTIEVDGSITELGLEVGLIDIKSKITSNKLDVTSIGVHTTQCDYDMSVVGDVIVTDTPVFNKTLSIILPKNISSEIVTRKVRIIAHGLDTDHSVDLAIRQHPTAAKFYCDNEVYFYSNGECFSSGNQDVGSLYFESDLETDINNRLKFVLVDDSGSIVSLSGSAEIIQVSNKTANHLGCSVYRAFLKLPPNFSDNVIEGYIKVYQQDGNVTQIISETTRFMQGNYCVSLQERNSDGVVIREIFGSSRQSSNIRKIGPYEVSAINSSGEDGPVLYLQPSRVEPDGYGSWRVFSAESCSISINDSNKDIWRVSNSDIPIGTYLKEYSTFIEEAGEGTYLLKNRYNVKSSYTKQELNFDITVRLTVDYPDSSSGGNYIPALTSSLTMDYILQLKKMKLTT